MLEESVPAILASLSSWFTPTVLFVVLNIVIGTIAVTSKTAHDHRNRHVDADEQHRPRLLSRGSSILARFKSINLYRHASTAIPLQNLAPIPTSTLESDGLAFEALKDESRPIRARRVQPEAERFDFENLREVSRPIPSRRVEAERFDFETFKDESRPIPPRRVEFEAGSFDFGTLKNESRPIPHQRVQGKEERFDFETLKDESPAIPPRRLERNEDRLEFETLNDESDGFEVETLEDAFRVALDSSGQYNRSQSDSRPTAGEPPARLAGKMKKSASSKSAFDHFKAAEVLRRKDGVPRVEEEEEEEEEEAEEGISGGGEVDARADDFINRFRKQLQIQRLDSIMRYKEMLNRGK